MWALEDVSALYTSLIRANASAFSKELFKVAYHSLSAAMYLALNLQDAIKMGEVERLARAQWQVLKTHTPRSYPTNEPTYIALYADLIHLADSRRSLLSNKNFT